jgi:amidase
MLSCLPETSGTGRRTANVGSDGFIRGSFATPSDRKSCGMRLFEYISYDAIGLAEAIRTGKLGASEILDEAVAIADTTNPSLNAIVHMQVDRAKAAIDNGLPEGPLSGVPFLLKDLGAEAIGFPGDNGSRLLANTHYKQNSNLVKRLSAAGVVIFGRTTAPEGGIGTATEAVVYGGPTRNPWNLEHTPGGSSGGAAAAVSAGVVPAAHGSDGGGSIRVPASCCGLFGFKPTRARMPDGPFAGEGWAGMATDGFLTRSVRDNALLLDTCSGADLGAPYMAPPLYDSYSAAVQAKPARLRIALCATTFDGAPVHQECTEAVVSTARLLEEMGHIVEEARPSAGHIGMMHAWTKIVACGTALWVRRKLEELGRPLGEFDLEPVARNACEYARGLSGDAYLEAVEQIHAYGRQMAAFFNTYDILLTPTLADLPAAIGRFDHSRANYLDFRLGPEGVFAYSPYAAAFNASGQPAASVPWNLSQYGLPIGVHLAARFGADEELMSLCADLERAKPWFDKRPTMQFLNRSKVGKEYAGE